MDRGPDKSMHGSPARSRMYDGDFYANRRNNLQWFFSIVTQSQHEPPSADSPFAKEVASLAEAGRGLCYPNRRMGLLLSEGHRNAKKPTPKTGFTQ